MTRLALALARGDRLNAELICERARWETEFERAEKAEAERDALKAERDAALADARDATEGARTSRWFHAETERDEARKALRAALARAEAAEAEVARLREALHLARKVLDGIAQGDASAERARWMAAEFLRQTDARAALGEPQP
jgi:hypothetical protein